MIRRPTRYSCIFTAPLAALWPGAVEYLFLVVLYFPRPLATGPWSTLPRDQRTCLLCVPVRILVRFVAPVDLRGTVSVQCAQYTVPVNYM